MIDQINVVDAMKYADKFINLGIAYLPKLILAIITLLVGLRLIKMLGKGFEMLMRKRGIDESLIPFLRTVVTVVLKVMLVISVISMIGIAVTSFIALLGAAGVAIGMALSGTLQNFAGGVLILILKPFKSGDFVEALGYTGIVKEIHIFHTFLTTTDNKSIILPNGPLANSSLINYTAQDKRRVEWIFGVAYGSDYDAVKRILIDLIYKDARILKDPEPFIGLHAMADSSVNIIVRAWTPTQEYWEVFFELNENVYKTFNQNGINIPFPQMDVHVKNMPQ